VKSAVILVALLTSAPALAQVPQPWSSQARPGQAVPKPAAAPAPATAVLRGRVISADAGAPVMRARVSATGAAGTGQFATATDGSGAWELARVPAGRYVLSASKTPYLKMEFGQRNILEPGKPIEVATGQVIEKLDFALPRGAVISGRVADDLGDPAAFVRVYAMRNQFIDGRRQPVRSGVSAMTDDLGQYRLYGLLPGTYFVATETTMWSNALPEDMGISFAATYYPGTTQASDAQAVKVAAGQERPGVDFQQVATRLSAVSGLVLDQEGVPVNGATVILNQNSRAGSSGSGIQVASADAAGRWRFGNVAPGTYVANALKAGAQASGVRSGSAEFAVAGQDLRDVVVTVTPGARISGVIEFDAGSPPDSVPPGLRVEAGTDGPGWFSYSGASTIHADWSFEVVSISPGDRVLRLSGLPAGYTLRSATVDGSDILDTPHRFTGSEQVTGVRLVVTKRVSELSGGVTDDRARPAKDYSVLLFSTDSAKWNPGTRFRALARPDQNGRYKVSGLPPGEYFAIALPYLGPDDQEDPEFLEEIRDRATKVMIGEGEVKVLELKLVPDVGGGQP